MISLCCHSTCFHLLLKSSCVAHAINEGGKAVFPSGEEPSRPQLVCGIRHPPAPPSSAPPKTVKSWREEREGGALSFSGKEK